MVPLYRVTYYECMYMYIHVLIFGSVHSAVQAVRDLPVIRITALWPYQVSPHELIH